MSNITDFILFFFSINFDLKKEYSELDGDESMSIETNDRDSINQIDNGHNSCKLFVNCNYNYL